MEKLYLDDYLFRWCAKELKDATPEKICEFYVRTLVFKNEGYLKHLQDKYKLPNDLLKMHTRIVELARGIKVK